MQDIIAELPAPELRASGRTTRLVDEYIQALFTRPGEWIEVRDHEGATSPHQANKAVLVRILDRIEREHKVIKIEVHWRHTVPSIYLIPKPPVSGY